MKLIKYFSAFGLTVLILLAACNGGREEKLSKIKDLESRLLQDSLKAKDEVAAYNLQVAYTEFAEKYPTDSLAPEYLFKAANLSMSLNWGKSAMDILDKFTSIYPDHKRAAEAMFYKGFVYDNQLNDDAKAGEFYRAFLKKYPNHEFASSAEASIKNLGKTDEELIREFEKMNADTSKAIEETTANEVKESTDKK